MAIAPSTSPFLSNILAVLIDALMDALFCPKRKEPIMRIKINLVLRFKDNLG
jgi:hypothetical protein